VRAAILARDVSVALWQHGDSSILNIFPAQVIETIEDGDGHVLIRLDASGKGYDVPYPTSVSKNDLSD
jgi:ABC-type molybdate transport system ATPase subunit